MLALEGFWETSGFLINVLMFLLVGMQIDAQLLVAEAGAVALALLALHGGRAIAVYGSFAALRLLWKEAVPMRWQHVMVVGNIKGALSMAAVLALPVDLPYRSRLVTIVFGVTFVTLVMQALPFKAALKWLQVTISAGDVEIDRAKARLVSARRGLSELDDLLATGLVSRKDHAVRRASFQRLVIEAEAVIRRAGDDAAHDHVDIALLHGRKAALKEAARRGLIDADAAAEQISGLDRELVQLSKEGEG